MIMNLLSVAIGGALGAMARYGLSLSMMAAPFGLPPFAGTLIVNIIGCALMGIMAALLPLMPFLQGVPRAFIMVGFLGALTTFSSFALDAFHLLEKQQYGVMASYMLASFALSLAAFFIMHHLTRWGLS